MVEIIHIGHSCFKIRGKQATLITDPFNPEMVGIKFPSIEADIVTVSHDHKDHNFIQGISGEPVIISGPGEYEAKGTRIIGLATYHDEQEGTKRGRNTVYRIEIDGISIVHCGDLGHKLNDKETELLDGVDILLIPVGGEAIISSATASEVVAQLEPKIVVPMHYKTTKINQEIFGKLQEVNVFLKEMGKEGILPQPKLTITKDKLPDELMVVVLEQ